MILSKNIIERDDKIMIEIYNPWMFRIERYHLSDNGVLYSFYAEHSVNINVAPKNAICSIGCSNGDKFDIALKSLQSYVRDCRIVLQNSNMEFDPNDSMFSDIRKFIQSTFYKMHLVRVNPLEDVPSQFDFCDRLITAGSENPNHELGDVLFRPANEKEKDTLIRPMVLIAAVPIKGIITMIPRCAQYTLWSGKLAVLSEDAAIRKLDHSITKSVYIVADVYDEFDINEYAISKENIGYRIRHIFNDYQSNTLDVKTYGKIDEMEEHVFDLFQVNSSGNLFRLGGLPKGIWRKNNELVTRI